MKENRIKHLMYGPDGNRRYAAEKGISFADAYNIAARRLVDFTRWCFEDEPVDELSLWVMQEYNLDRPPEQIKPITRAIMDCIGYVCKSDIVRKQDIQVNVVGELDRFFDVYDGDMSELNAFLTHVKDNSGRKLNFIFPYNGSKELARAWKRCDEDGIEPTFANLSQRWSIPLVTLFLRSGQPDGFNRLSDYYPGIEQARLISTPTYPQELTQKELHEIIESFLNLKDSFEKL